MESTPDLVLCLGQATLMMERGKEEFPARIASHLKTSLLLLQNISSIKQSGTQMTHSVSGDNYKLHPAEKSDAEPKPLLDQASVSEVPHKKKFLI